MQRGEQTPSAENSDGGLNALPAGGATDSFFVDAGNSAMPDVAYEATSAATAVSVTDALSFELQPHYDALDAAVITGLPDFDAAGALTNDVSGQFPTFNDDFLPDEEASIAVIADHHEPIVYPVLKYDAFIHAPVLPLGGAALPSNEFTSSSSYDGFTNTGGFTGHADMLTPIFSQAGWFSGSSTNGGTSSTSTTTSSATSTSTTSGLIINVTYDANVASAPSGFTATVASVVQFFQSHFSDPVTININVGYGEVGGQSLSSGVLGESSTYLNSYSYSQLKSALTADAKTADDSTAVATLSGSDPTNGGQFWVSTAESKALGLAGASSSVDGYVGFSSAANIFDYINSNGVTAGQYDFFGVVAHEISEVMGRQLMTGINFNGSASYEPLDLFHYSLSGVRDFVGTHVGYFSINGGVTNIDNFNTNSGGDYGDWASSAGNDAFNAFSNSGVVNAVTAADLKALDVIGWDFDIILATRSHCFQPDATRRRRQLSG